MEVLAKFPCKKCGNTIAEVEGQFDDTEKYVLHGKCTRCGEPMILDPPFTKIEK